jgi:hypothetical protein
VGPPGPGRGKARRPAISDDEGLTATGFMNFMKLDFIIK